MVLLDGPPAATPVLLNIPGFLPFINGGRFEGLVEVTAKPAKVADVKEVDERSRAGGAPIPVMSNVLSALPAAAVPSSADLSKERATAREIWQRAGEMATLPSEIKAIGPAPLKTSIGDRWLGKAHTPTLGPPPLGPPSPRRTHLRKHERELRERELAQRSNHVLAADVFDQHMDHVGASAERAHHLLAETMSLVSATDNGHLFRQHLRGVTGARFVAPPRLALSSHRDSVRRPSPRGSTPSVTLSAESPPFDLYRSIWRPRAESSSSHDLYDSDEVLHRRFTQDWQRMVLVLGVAKLITSPAMAATTAAPADALGAASSAADIHAPAVVAVGEVLRRHYMMLCAVFRYYAAAESGELDTLPLPAFEQLCSDCKLISTSTFSKALPPARIVDIFRASAEADQYAISPRAQRRTSKAATGAASRPRVGITEDVSSGLRMRRVEFFVALLRIALTKHPVAAAPRLATTTAAVVVDASVALERIVKRDVAASVEAGKLQPSDAFRRRHAYTERVCAELRRKRGWLQRCFQYALTLAGGEVVVAGSGGAGGSAGGGPLLRLDQWLELLETLELLTDSYDVGKAEAVLAFSWSRMVAPAAADGGGGGPARRGVPRDACLPFEGFVEAICRVAGLKALPTDEEIAQMGQVDAGWYCKALRDEKPEEYVAMLRARGRAWGTSTQLAQPMDRCVAHLIELMAHQARQIGLHELVDYNLK